MKFKYVKKNEDGSFTANYENSRTGFNGKNIPAIITTNTAKLVVKDGVHAIVHNSLDDNRGWLPEKTDFIKGYAANWEEKECIEFKTCEGSFWAWEMSEGFYSAANIKTQ